LSYSATIKGVLFLLLVLEYRLQTLNEFMIGNFMPIILVQIGKSKLRHCPKCES
jgi:hypothetical protein